MAAARRAAAQSEAADCTTAVTSGMCRGIAIAERPVDFTLDNFESADWIAHLRTSARKQKRTICPPSLLFRSQLEAAPYSEP